MSVFDYILFPPQAGGQHLSLLASTAYIKGYDKEYITMYRNMSNDMDQYSSYYADKAPLHCCHIEKLRNLINERNKIKYPYLGITVLSIPNDQDSLAFKRMEKKTPWMSNSYVRDTFKYIYSKEYVTKIFDINPDQVYEVQTEKLFTEEHFGEVLQQLIQRLPVNQGLCELLHKIWLNKITESLKD
jgi:hypothetical protein